MRRTHSLRHRSLLEFTLVLAFAAPMANAVAAAGPVASEVFILDQTNSAVFSDGMSFIQVSVSSDTAGSVLFDVTPVYGFNQGSAFGFQSFGFNDLGGTVLTASDFSVPTGWAVDLPPASAQDGFGKFDYVVERAGFNRLAALSFAISGLGGATPEETLALFHQASSGNAAQGNFYFATHLAGYTAGAESSAFFAGSTLAPVPEPEPYAMLLSGLGLLGAVARRRI